MSMLHDLLSVKHGVSALDLTQLAIFVIASWISNDYLHACAPLIILAFNANGW